MSIVYVVQDPSGRNIDPAKEYGRLIVMLTGKETMEKARQKLDSYLQTFTSEDYLLLVGNPLFIAMATMTAVNLHPSSTDVAFLIWDREHYIYQVKRIPVYA